MKKLFAAVMTKMRRRRGCACVIRRIGSPPALTGVCYAAPTVKLSKEGREEQYGKNGCPIP